MFVVQVFRATHGKAKVWGKSPSFITAKYTPADGQEKTSLLLTAGKPLTHLPHAAGKPLTHLPHAADQLFSP